MWNILCCFPILQKKDEKPQVLTMTRESLKEGVRESNLDQYLSTTYEEDLSTSSDKSLYSEEYNSFSLI